MRHCAYRNHQMTMDSNGTDSNGNAFLQTVKLYSVSEGYNPLNVLPHFKSFTSANFAYGDRTDCISKTPLIPDTVWQRVCDHFDLSLHRPFRGLYTDRRPLVFKSRSDVFISSKITDRLIKRSQSPLILEQFQSPQRLYQYLNWTFRMNKVVHSMRKLEGRNGGKVLVFNVELHDHRGHGLYALCVPNDVASYKFQPWQLVNLLTDSELIVLLGIGRKELPRGVRGVSSHFREYRSVKGDLKRMKAVIKKVHYRGGAVPYGRLKCIQTASNKGGRKRGDKLLVVIKKVDHRGRAVPYGRLKCIQTA